MKRTEPKGEARGKQVAGGGALPRLLRLGPLVLGGLCLAALAACDLGQTGPGSQARPPGLDAATKPMPRSERSAALARHYKRVQAHLLAQGLLRTGGGDVDTPYDADDIARNFERIAFYDEYERGAGLRAADDVPDVLRKWVSPVRVELEFGASVTPDMQARDRPAVESYVARLARVTGHPISMSGNAPNFHVFITSEDDRAATVAKVRGLVPDMGAATLALVRDPPRSIYCFVLTFEDRDRPNTYDRAIAFIRAEQPDLMRRSCIHEEIAQGLGLGNDSATARPSIFNDDEEFALLTTHDEALLRLLYNPALRPGMSLGQARPLIRRILAGDPGQI